jgi:DnaA family protein
VQHQLLLSLTEAPPSTLDNFIAGGNEAVLSALRAFGGDPHSRAVYLWGGPGSGRSHLLHAWSTEHGGAYVDAREQPALAGVQSRAILAVDNCDALDDQGQIALFNLYNLARSAPDEAPAYLLVSGPLPPPQLQLRDDVKSRPPCWRTRKRAACACRKK